MLETRMSAADFWSNRERAQADVEEVSRLRSLINPFRELEREIDDAAVTKHWVLLDGPTLERMIRDGWRPTPEERTELLRKALDADEVPVVKGLLDLGADPNGSYFGTNTPPLMMVATQTLPPASTARLSRYWKPSRFFTTRPGAKPGGGAS